MCYFEYKKKFETLQNQELTKAELTETPSKFLISTTTIIVADNYRLDAMLNNK